MTEYIEIFKHIDGLLQRLYDPLIKTLDAHNQIIPSLKAGQAVNRTSIDDTKKDVDEMKGEIREIKKEISALVGKVAGVVAVVNVLMMIAFFLLNR